MELLSEAEGVKSRLLASSGGGFTGGVVPVPVPVPTPVVPVAVEAADATAATPTWLLLSRESNGFTGLLLLTDFSLSPVPLESSDLAIFCKVRQAFSGWIHFNQLQEQICMHK